VAQDKLCIEYKIIERQLLMAKNNTNSFVNRLIMGNNKITELRTKTPRKNISFIETVGDIPWRA
jgi:hypothetical protein